MLAPPISSEYNQYGHSSIHAQQSTSNGMQVGYQHSGERPKLYTMDPTHQPTSTPPMLNHVMQPGQMNEYHPILANQTTPRHHQQRLAPPHYSHHAQVMTPHGPTIAHTPQHHHTHEYEGNHEPLVMHMQPNQYYHPMNSDMMHMPTEYSYGSSDSASGATPSSNLSGTKRSREDLNMKEKKRMFKLNDRINQLKQVLDEAGVQTKKNKQSILDNAAHYIEMLQNKLVIAKQKAERAEQQAESFRHQAHAQNQKNKELAASSPMSNLYKRSFMQANLPKVILDVQLQPVSYNNAFIKHTGQSESYLSNAEHVHAALCTDSNTLQELVQSVIQSQKPLNQVVDGVTVHGNMTISLHIVPIIDDNNTVSTIEVNINIHNATPLEATSNSSSIISDNSNILSEHDDTKPANEKDEKELSDNISEPSESAVLKE